jgi:hypothetical protein
MNGPASWLRLDPVPDVQTLDDEALLECWTANRNGLLGHVAAEEMMKRLCRRQADETA